MSIFDEFVEGKATVVAGKVRLLPAGWAEFGPLFGRIGVELKDGMEPDEFRRHLRNATSLEKRFSNAALLAQLNDPGVDQATKDAIRELRIVAVPESAADSDT